MELWRVRIHGGMRFRYCGASSEKGGCVSVRRVVCSVRELEMTPRCLSRVGRIP